MPVLDPEPLREFAGSIFRACGTPSGEAAIVADSLVTSNLLGHDSHGVIRVIQYVSNIQEGLIVPGAPLEVVLETESALKIDCHWNFGQVSARRGIRRAMEKARGGSVVQLLLNCSYHVGRLGEYTHQAAREGMLGLAMVNAAGGYNVAPFGGKQARLGTNPISFAAPWDGDRCLLLDATTSIAPEGKVRVRRNQGQPVPDGWILDSEGNPSRDPNDLYGPPRGALLPLGGPMGHKGFGFSLMVEILAGILTGAGAARPNPDHIGNGFFALIINIERFLPLARFQSDMAEFVQFLKSCPTVPGLDQIIIPGEPEFGVYRQRKEEGIPIDDETWRQLCETAGSLNVPVPSI